MHVERRVCPLNLINMLQKLSDIKNKKKSLKVASYVHTPQESTMAEEAVLGWKK